MLKINSVLDKISDCEAVIHFAARSLVEESLRLPSFYYKNNVDGSSALLDVLKYTSIRKIIFSSSASVYGNPISSSINEFHQTIPLSTYGETKLKTEIEITQYCSNDNYGAVTLRYFNVSGAVLSGDVWLSEKHTPETHLIPNILNSNILSPVKIFGSNWNTKDGSCIRDYVDVVSIARAHRQILEKMQDDLILPSAMNLGSESGTSVLEIFKAVKETIAPKFTYNLTQVRTGDPASIIADCTTARKSFDWTPNLNIEELIVSGWKAYEREKVLF
jgi:UDP-glucose 4-epimerase